MKNLKNLLEKLENAMIAITFAEAGEFETARETMCKQSCKQKKLQKRAQRYHAPKVQNYHRA